MRRVICALATILLTLLTIWRLFSGLGQAPFERWDEVTNVEVVTNLITTRSFPALYAFHQPFFEKPPLWYYLSALIARAVGVSKNSMRALSVVSGLCIILFTVYLAWRWWGTASGFTAWIVLLTTNQLFITNPAGYFATHTFRSADLDALLIAFMIVAFAACASLKKCSVIAGLATGLGVLTKGPFGFVPLVIATLLFIRKKRYFCSLWTAWIVGAAVAVPWYLYMTARFGSTFLSAGIGYHLIDRAISPLEGHASSPLFYVWVLASRSVFLSWELLAGSLIWLTVKKKFTDMRVLYSVCMTVVLFLIPTVVQTKLAWYILPVYPFAALTIAAAVGDLVHSFAA